jgi:outer membrane protein assembly factor BamB
MRLPRLRSHKNRFAIALIVLVAVFLNGCGGGGGSDAGSSASRPYILGVLISFPTGAVPAGFVQSGFNSGASVLVLNDSDGTPITNASVSINGVALTYSAAYQEYEGDITVAPGDNVTLNVTVAGTAYTASGIQFTAYPTITAPLAGATWSSFSSSLVAWSGVAPTTDSLYTLGVTDLDGQLIWPPGNAFQALPTTATSFTIDPYSLTAGSRLVILGLATALDIPNAAADSGLVIGGFNYVPITVTDTLPPPVLLSIAVTPNNPIIANGKTRQLLATGTYSDSSTRDLTTQVTWTSTDLTKATVSASGLVTGMSYGSATIKATSGSIFGSTLVNVFQPTPSPSPPLSQSVAYQIDYAHSGRAVFADPITFPGSATWSVTLNGTVSYPLIADGMVFVTTLGPGVGGVYAKSLYALNEQTGSIIWGPIPISGSGYFLGHAFDHGKVFVINWNGLMRSFDAATGQAGWSTQLPFQYAFSSPPTAVNGVVYVGGAGTGGTFYAVDEINGNVLWTANVAGGDHSSPAVSGDGVFVSYPYQVYKFDPLTGSVIWHYSGAYHGGGGTTAAYANGLLYVRDPLLIFDAAVGTIVGNFTSTPIPAFSMQTGFFLSGGTLKGIDLSSKNVLWSFAGDGTLVSAPIVVNQVVIVGSSSGNVYAVDAATGSQIWSGNAGSAIAGPDEISGVQMTGFGAGDGFLIVPAGNVITAWRISGP